MKSSRILLFGILVFTLIWIMLLPRVMERTDIILGGDAYAYHAGGVNILRHSFYTFDGSTPAVTREPGMSLYLAMLYGMFGVGNFPMVFLINGILYGIAILCLTREWSRWTSRKTANISAILLLLFPASFSITFSLNRECLAFILLAFFATAWMRMVRQPTILRGMFTGVLLGIAILVYAPFLIFPVFLAVTSVVLRVPWKTIAVTVACVVIPLIPWGIRNEVVAGRLCLTGCYRPTIQWYVRGERSEHLRGIEPLQCLIAEYITRDWSKRSPYCNFNAVWHVRWPNGFIERPESLPIGEAAIGKIFRHFPYYLWDSIFEALELHLPYVHFWGRTYNILATLGTVVLYLGIALGLSGLRKGWKTWILPFTFIIYVTGVFSLTDATPRYIMPIVFCYALLAGIGYDQTLKHLWNRLPSSSRH